MSNISTFSPAYKLCNRTIWWKLKKTFAFCLKHISPSSLCSVWEREEKKESLWISIKWSLGREGCVRVGELMCCGQMFNNNGRTDPAEKHTFHPPHPTVAAGTHTHRRPHARKHTHRQAHVPGHSHIITHTLTHTIMIHTHALRNAWQCLSRACTHTHITFAHGHWYHHRHVCGYVCVFMTSAGHSAYGPHLGTMGMENDWLDELPDCERWLEAC